VKYLSDTILRTGEERKRRWWGREEEKGGRREGKKRRRKRKYVRCEIPERHFCRQGKRMKGKGKKKRKR
jgi:hypothetical protein